MNYRFVLEPYKSMKNIYHCPQCNKKTFTRYIDKENNNEYLHPEVGRCSREIKCGYHYSPKMYFEDNKFISCNYKKKHTYLKNVNTEKEKTSIDYITKKELLKTINNPLNYKNNFINFLNTLFNKSITTELVKKYYIGTCKKWGGATVFWQIDIDYKIRTGKIMLYDKEGNRVKKPYNHISWYHKQNHINNNNNYHLKQCLFGEHLIKTESNKTIAIVESEKTAIISSVLIPEFIWLATGGLNNLNNEKTEVLKRRNVILFPDLNAIDKWKLKAKSLSPLINIKIYDALELHSNQQEKEKGYDIADYLINEILKYK